MRKHSHPMKRHLLTTPSTDRPRVWPGDRWWPRFFLVPSHRIDHHSQCVTDKQHYSWELTYMFMTFSWFKGKSSLKVKGQPSSTCWCLHTRVVHHHQCCPVSVKHCSLGKFDYQLHSICWTPTSQTQQPFPAEQLMGTGVIQCLSHKNAALVLLVSLQMFPSKNPVLTVKTPKSKIHLTFCHSQTQNNRREQSTA